MATSRLTAELAQALQRLAPEVREREPLRTHVSFRIGGPADILVLPRHLDELHRVVMWLFAQRIPFTVLGQGSNVLISDAGIRGVVVKIGKGLDRVTFEGDRVTAEAGAGLPHLARRAVGRGLSGLEFAAGIPASIGGAVVMNAGAHGHSMQDIVRTVRLLTPDGEQRMDHQALGYAYRTSVLQDHRLIVIEATLQLIERDPQTVRAQTDQWLLHRSQTQPVGPPSSGCVFRNPSGDHAGRLIDLAGAKGLQLGGARVSEVHANYVLNTGEATAEDVLALMHKVNALVMENFNLRLEPEIKLLGEFERRI